MSGSEKKKVNRNTYDINPEKKRVTRKLLEVSRCSRTKQRGRNLKKSVLHVQSCVFANRPFFDILKFILGSETWGNKE